MAKRKKTLVGSMVALRCPHCREESMYVNPTLYTLHKLGDTHKNCPGCGTDLKPEPGFYFGAAYVSWGLTVALWVSVLVSLKIFNALGWIEFGFLTHPVTFLLTGTIVSLFAFPYLFRISRSMWAHMFIKPQSIEADSLS
jgi:hypothetical protein